MNFKELYKRISPHELPDFEKKLIEENFIFSKYRKNEIIIDQDRDCDKIFFVLKGVLRIFYYDKNGAEVTRTFILENEFCTNLISFSNQAENNENIQCLENVLLFSITRENFYQMLQNSHVLTNLYAKVLEFFINKHLKHFQFMNTLSSRERVEEFLAQPSQIKDRVKDKIIATYLGVTPEFFSSTKKEFFIDRNPS